jgi:hypothetical protein
MTTQQNNQREQGDVSVLRSLRQLMPHRVLSYSEALQRAEAQATRLLALHEISAGPVPMEIVTEQPRIRLEHAYDLPVSGSAVWDGSYWIITLNAGEFDLRQRFSLLHEYKHIIDHPTRHLIMGDKQLSADDMAEKVADYFAACVLMPKAWIKAAYFGGIQSVPTLVEPVSRRAPANFSAAASTRGRPSYFRTLSQTAWSSELQMRELACTA